MRLHARAAMRLVVLCAVAIGLLLVVGLPMPPAAAADGDVTFDTPDGTITDADSDDYLLASDPADGRTYTFSGTATWDDGTFTVRVLGAAMPDADGLGTVCETDELTPSSDPQDWSCTVTDSVGDSLGSYGDLRARIIDDQGDDDGTPSTMLPVAVLAPPPADDTALTIDEDDDTVVLRGDRTLNLHIEVYEGDLAADDDLSGLTPVCEDSDSDDDEFDWESDDWSCELDASEWEPGTHTYSVRYTPVDGPIYSSYFAVPSDFLHVTVELPEPEPEPEPTDDPEPEPTDEPTDEPMDEPTDEPSDEPTDQPTDEPTEQPTEEPTDEPTPSPTPAPTETPTPSPTPTPEPSPTAAPTPTPTPTASTEPDPTPAEPIPAPPKPSPTPSQTAAPSGEASAPIHAAVPEPEPYSPTTAPTATPSTTPTPTPTPSPTTTAPPTPEPSPTPDDGDRDSAAGVVAPGGSDDGSGGAPPSTFGHDLKTVSALASTPPAVWGGAALVGGAFVMFVALPSELLHATLRSNYGRAFGLLIGGWGRIKRVVPVVRGAVPAWVTASITLIAAALISAAAMATSVDGGVLVRMTLAMLAAFATTNLLSVALAWMLGGRFQAAPSLTLMPGFLLLSAASVIFSRLLGFQPAILFGILMIVSFGRQLRRTQQGVLSTVFCVTFLVIGGLAWVGYSALDPAATGFGAELTREYLTALATGGIGYCVVALLPMTYLEGLSIFRWSKLLWAGLYLAVIVIFLLTIVRMPNSWHELSGAAMVWCIAFGAFGIVSLAVWAWFRYRREPVDAVTPDSS